MVRDADTALQFGSKMQLSYNVENTQRAIGTRLSSHIVRKFGMTGLRENHISVRLRGTAGQSLGAFATQGLRLEVIGDANDYVGKGLSGGAIIVRRRRRPPLSRMRTPSSAIPSFTAQPPASCSRPARLASACVSATPARQRSSREPAPTLVNI